MTKGNDYEIFEGQDGLYNMYFPNDLNSGEYFISVSDDAGNRNLVEKGSSENKFTIDIDTPIFIGSIDLGQDDKGRFSDDRITSVSRPELEILMLKRG